MFIQYLIVVIIILLVLDRWKPSKFVELHQRLGNDWTYFPIIGNALTFMGNNEDMMTILMDTSIQALKRKYNAISFWLGNKLFVGIADIDQAVVVLKSTSNKNFTNKFTKYLTGNGSAFAPVDIWHRRRKILAPSFASRYVNKYITIFESHAKVMAENMESKVGNGNFSCWKFISCYALDSICESAFGVNSGMQRQPDHPFVNAFVESFKNIAARCCQPWLHFNAIYKLLPVYARQLHLKKTIHDFVDDLVSKNKRLITEKDGIEIENKNLTDKTNLKSLLQLMIENSTNTDKPYTDEELREETLVLSLAGTDTSAAGICFTILLLSQHSDVQERVYNEIQEVLKNSNEPLQLEDVLKLKYTKAVIKEALRLYPSIPFLMRHCEQDVKLPSGIILPKGCDLIISIWSIHRNPQHWGDDVNDFNPDRFMSDQTTNAFIPFGYGPRNCVGYQYAMLSMTTILVTLLRKYRFTPATNFTYNKTTPLRLSFDIMMKHVDRFTVQIEDRNTINEKL